MSASRRLDTSACADERLQQGIGAIRQELGLPEVFAPEVEAAATQAVAHPRLPAPDRSELPLVTIDPPGSMDLDQALHVATHGDGFRVHYAIADVAAFVAAGDPVDIEAQRRGQTLYGGHLRIPLYPPVLSEGGASLLPDQLRPALLWQVDLDAQGEIIATDVRRARVRSRARYDYAGVQAAIDAGNADPMWQALRTVGELRKRAEQRRGGISLPLPEQEIASDADGWQLSYRARHPVEDWNEQISLLTGMAAARLMLKARVGLLRTQPAPPDWAIERLRRTAHALGIDWPAALAYPEFVRTLDPRQPTAIAMMVACTSLLRGAGYAAFDGALPEQPAHWALATEYAHATAPLRRLCDRYVGEVCLAVCAGEAVPDWTRQALPGLSQIMQASDQRAHRFDRAVIDLTEAIVLAPRVGERFLATIVEVDRKQPTRGVAMLRDLAIEGPVQSTMPLRAGSEMTLTLAEADPARHTIRFEPTG